MSDLEKIQLFENKEVRTAWDEEKQEWFFSIVDVCGVLTGQPDYDGARKYWKVLKGRLIAEGFELVSNCYQLRMVSPKDGKRYKTDVGDLAWILRVIQSIPSKKAEPFKQWMAHVASERIDEIQDPELAILRGADYYRAKGYSEGWIHQRLQSIRIRKELTDEWKARGIDKEKDFAILTNELTKAWSGLTVREYKDLKGLKKESLRDSMTDIELVLNMLAEVSTKAISQVSNRQPSVRANTSLGKAARLQEKLGRTLKNVLERA